MLDDPYLRKEACSQMALLSDDAYEIGLENIRDALAAAEIKGERLVFDSEIDIFMMVAHTPTRPA